MPTNLVTLAIEIQAELEGLGEAEQKYYELILVRAQLLTAAATVAVADELHSIENNLKILDSIREPWRSGSRRKASLPFQDLTGGCGGGTDDPEKGKG